MQRATIFGVAGLLLARVLFASAAEPVVGADLTLAEAVELAVRDNPERRSLRARWESMRERPAQARALPNPMFAYSGMDMADRGEWPDTNEKRFMVEQGFPWFGKRGLRRDLAIEDAETMRQELEAMTQDVVRRVKENYFDLQAVQRAIVLTREEEDVLQRMKTVAETMYAAGERSQQDVIKAQAEITLLKQKQLELQAQETTLKAKLNILLDRRADAPLVLAATAPPGAPEAEVPALFAHAEKARPEIKGAESQIRRSQMERDLMRKEFRPDVRLGLEYRDLARDDNMIMFTVGFDLPIRLSKYRAGVREAEKMIESGKAALEAAQRQTSFEVQDAHYKLLTARRTLDLYRNELIPQAEARFVASEAGYRAGQVDFMDLLESERFRLEARIMAAMAEGAIGMQAARLERAIGGR
ncbi:MAG: TolC family protein [Verrucomicrobia bacterium]|nr:TolC family protein [Verrucomicrobiota bacterium]